MFNNFRILNIILSKKLMSFDLTLTCKKRDLHNCLNERTLPNHYLNSCLTKRIPCGSYSIAILMFSKYNHHLFWYWLNLLASVNTSLGIILDNISSQTYRFYQNTFTLTLKPRSITLTVKFISATLLCYCDWFKTHQQRSRS